MTFREALTHAFSQLYASPRLRDNALRDAMYLLVNTLGTTHASLVANYNRLLTGDQQAAFEDRILRRLTNEPIQYIVGECEFYGLPIRVAPAVLIPRSATEHVVEAVLEEFKARPGGGGGVRGTESGNKA
jgi:release factor glutamine methyltransferase